MPKAKFFAAVALGLFAAAGLGTPSPARADDATPDTTVSDDLRDIVEHDIGARFIYPETTRWHYISARPYVGSGTAICGTANGQTAARLYGGEQRFFAIIRDGRVKQSGFAGDRGHDILGSTAKLLNTLCPAP